MPDSTGFYVEVYHTNNDGGNWVQIGQTLSGNGTEDYFGHSVDISADGMTIVCGSPAGLGSDDLPGYVRVFSLEGDVILGTDRHLEADRPGHYRGSERR